MAEETPRPAARGSASSATSGRLRNRTSVAILPSASVTRGQGVAQRRDGQPVGVPRGRRWRRGPAARQRVGRQAEGVWQPTRRSARCRRPAFRRPRRTAPGSSTRLEPRGRRRPARGTTARPCSPNVNGSECCVRLLPTHSVSACCSARRRAPSSCIPDVGQQRRNGVAGQQHQGRVQHVLAGQRGVHRTAVHPRWRRCPASS